MTSGTTPTTRGFRPFPAPAGSGQGSSRPTRLCFPVLSIPLNPGLSSRAADSLRTMTGPSRSSSASSIPCPSSTRVPTAAKKSLVTAARYTVLFTVWPFVVTSTLNAIEETRGGMLVPSAACSTPGSARTARSASLTVGIRDARS